MYHAKGMFHRFENLIRIFLDCLWITRKGINQGSTRHSGNAPADQRIWKLHAVFYTNHLHDALNLLVKHFFYHLRGNIPRADTFTACGETKYLYVVRSAF